MRPYVVTVLVVALLGTGCGSTEPSQDREPETVTDIAQLQGTWTIKEWIYTRAADATQAVDWVAMGLLAGSLTIESSGTFVLSVRFPWGSGTDDGTLSIQDGKIYWDGQGDEELLPFVLRGGILTADWPETEFVDMDRDGQPEDCWFRMVFRRT